MPTEIHLEDYGNKYPNAQISREEGVLEVCLHSEGKSLIWTIDVHNDLPNLFSDIAGDRENRCVILTGVSDAFCNALDHSTFRTDTPWTWDNIFYEGQRLLNNLLEINVPVINAVNGPARFHAEIAVMGDIVIVADHAVFRDPHFQNGTVPGDGCHSIWNHLLGVNRGRYFLLTGQELSAREAVDYGVANEILPLKELMPRARALAHEIAGRPPLTCRYARQVLTRQYRRLLADDIGYGLALQGLAKVDRHFRTD